MIRRHLSSPFAIWTFNALKNIKNILNVRKIIARLSGERRESGRRSHNEEQQSYLIKLNDALRKSEANLKATRLLHDLAMRVVTDDQKQSLYQHILDTAIALMDSDMGSLQILDQERNELQLQAWREFHPDAVAFWQTVSWEDGSVCSAALQQGERIIVPDIDNWNFAAGTDDVKFFHLCGIKAVQSTPLISRSGQLIGMFSTQWRNPHLPDGQELRFLDLLARQAADLIVQWRNKDALQHYNEELEAEVTKRTAELSESLRNLEISRGALQHQAHHDALTGLPNRVLLQLRLVQGLQQAVRQRTKVAVVFMDLDHFKHVNDSLGHRLGDQLLQQVAHRLLPAFRVNDTIGRIGGDEFVAVLADIKTSQQVIDIVNRIMARFESPFNLDGRIMHITTSLGLCLFPDDGADAEVLLRNADSAMYKAKRNGRNTYCFYDSTMTATAHEQISLESALRKALKQEELSLVYQPQFDLQSHALIGLEALLRWQHPEWGAVSPARFIAVAERSGLIRDIGTWVLQQVCMQAGSWFVQGFDFGRISINVSTPQFQDENFIRIIESTLMATELPPHYLELEVTESLLMENTSAKIQLLEQLRRLGIQLAIDDFGTGYSSLSYLKRLPIDELKIDQSFMQDIPHDANSRAIVDAILALGQAMNLRIIAEGVENQAHVEFLQARGCHAAQGYFYSYPLAPQEAEKQFRSVAVPEVVA